MIVAPLTRLGITRSSVARTGDTADGYRVIAARRLNRAHTSLSLVELGLIAIVLGIATAVAVPEYLDLRQDAREDSAKSRLTQATQTLQHRHASAGTYAGAALPAGVHVRSVGPTAFCIETMAGSDTWHVSRGSKPTSGACAR